MSKLPQLGYPRARLAVQDFKADHKDRKLTALVRIDTGPQVRFGEIKLDGLATVKPGYVMKAVTWKTGDIYDSRKIEAFRQELTEMNLFASIRVDTDDPLQGDRQPVKIRLREAKHRFEMIRSPRDFATHPWRHRGVASVNCIARAGMANVAKRRDEN